MPQEREEEIYFSFSRSNIPENLSVQKENILLYPVFRS